MKVGIITVFDAVNYGSYLQAYCLQRVLNEKGCNNIRMIKDSSLLYEKWRITSLISYNPHKIKFKSKLAMGYMKAWRQFKKTRTKTGYDIVIVGSDEMWEVNNITMKPRPVFWGVGLQTKKLVSYAVSSNTAKTDDLKRYPFIEEGLKKFNKISVRDKSTYAAYSPLLHEPPTLCIDPTLLIDLHRIAKHTYKRDNYILCYTYTFKAETLAAVKKLAKDCKKKLIVVGQNFEWADETIPADPFEFLGLIEDADFVVTDTFHGTVLSIALNKQFAVAAYKEKVFRIIEQFELLDRNIDQHTDISDVYQRTIDYDAVNHKIRELRKQSLDFISSCLSL